MPILDLPTAPRIAALLIGRLGDLIVATPLLRALRQARPRARLSLVVSGRIEEAARLIPWADEVLVLERPCRLFSHLKLLATLRRLSCDLMLDLNPSFSRTAAGLAAMAQARDKLSFKKGRWDFVFTRQLAPAGAREPMLDRYARLAEALGLAYEPRPELRLWSEHEARAEELLAAMGPRAQAFKIAIHPGNFKKFDNRWPEEKFAELTDLLAGHPQAQIFYMAGPGEERPVRDIVSKLKAPVPILPPNPIGVTGAWMKRMDLCVLNITGTTHLAAAVGAPTFGFYSGYTDAVWRLRGPIHHGVVSNSWESCRGISVEEAYSALKPLLSGAAR